MRTLTFENANHEITIERIACPLHVIAIKNGMKQIDTGEILKINTTESVAPELFAAAKQLGKAAKITDQFEIYLLKA